MVSVESYLVALHTHSLHTMSRARLALRPLAQFRRMASSTASTASSAGGSRRGHTGRIGLVVGGATVSAADRMLINLRQY